MALVDTLSGVSSVLGGLGVGAYLGQLLTAGKERREVHAGVIAAYREVEELRWVVAQQDNYDELMRAIGRFESAALVARLPRPAVDVYVALTRAAHATSFQTSKYKYSEGTEGGIGEELADAIFHSSTLVQDAIWSGPVKRIRLARRARDIVRQADGITYSVARKSWQGVRRRVQHLVPMPEAAAAG
jgi:hypothetical protein